MRARRAERAQAEADAATEGALLAERDSAQVLPAHAPLELEIPV